MPGAARFTVEVPPQADGSTRARIGRLELTHGVVETPQFMPVGTNATVKALSPDDIREVGASIILANTYHDLSTGFYAVKTSCISLLCGDMTITGNPFSHKVLAGRKKKSRKQRYE